MRRFRTVIPTLALAVLVLGPTAAARADAPQFRTITVSDTEPAPYCTFPVMSHEEGTLRVAVHTDRAGTPTFEIDHPGNDHLVSFTNVATGKTLISPQPVVRVVDSTTGTQTFHGLVYRFVVPGEGAVLVSAGAFTMDAAGNVTFQSGHLAVLQGDTQGLCAALAAP